MRCQIADKIIAHIGESPFRRVHDPALGCGGAGAGAGGLGR
jgi:hypothetical protein